MTPSWLLELMQRPRLAGLRLYPEETASVAVANMLRQATLDGRLRAVWLHVKNEGGARGQRHRARMAIAVAMGLIPGALDYVFLWPGHHGFIELKVSASLSSHQRNFIVWCDRAGVKTAVCKAKTPAAIVALVERTLIEWGALAPSIFPLREV